MSNFRILTQLNDPANAKVLRHQGNINSHCAPYFQADNLAHRFIRELAARRALPFKEVLESFEFFAAVRRQLRSARMADLCAGHGLVGILFALFERDVEHVQLVEQTPPASRAKILEAAQAVAPWTAAKIEFCDTTIESYADQVPPGTAIVCVHGCGHRTDRCIEIGLRSEGNIAVMPCCRSKRKSTSSPAVAREVGFDMAIDIDRTYRMEAAGRIVRWTEIPAVITPMHRILVGRRNSE